MSIERFRAWVPRRSRLGIMAAVAALLCLASWPARGAEAAEGAEAGGEAGEPSAIGMVEQTSDEMLELIEEAKGYYDEDPERLYREVEGLLSQVVDFQSFARSVMGPHSRDATPEQIERFAETFKWGLVRTYAGALTEFDDGKVVVVPPDRPPRNPDRQTVKMEIHTASGEVYPVLYSVTREDDGSWVIRNLIVNGVNMGLTYRNQFNSAMKNPKYGGELDTVIDGWSELLKTEAPDLGIEEDGGEQEA